MREVQKMEARQSASQRAMQALEIEFYKTVNAWKMFPA